MEAPAGRVRLGRDEGEDAVHAVAAAEDQEAGRNPADGEQGEQMGERAPGHEEEGDGGQHDDDGGAHVGLHHHEAGYQPDHEHEGDEAGGEAA